MSQMKGRILVVTAILLGTWAVLAIGCQQPSKGAAVRCLLDWKPSMQNAAFYLAKSHGYYAARGLDVSISPGNGAPEATTLIGNGTYDIGISSGAATAMGVEKGLPVVCVAAMYQRMPTVIYSFADKGIRKPEDLYGKTVGINADSINADEYRAFIAATKLDRSRIKEVGVTSGSDPLLTDKVDALLDYADNDPVILAVQTGKPVSELKLADYGVRAYGLNIVANRNYLERHPDEVKRFLGATLQAWAGMIADPATAAKDFGALQPSRNAKADEQSARVVGEECTSDDTKRHGLGHQQLDAWAATVATLRSLGLVKSPLDPAKLFTNDYLPAFPGAGH
jgi:NitT/TauT family transport system substrate-binding protein